MSPVAFERLAIDQLKRSRAVLERQIGRSVTLLAWPFGLKDADLAGQAAQAGYLAAFKLGNRSADAADPLYDVPRHLMADGVDPRPWTARLEAACAGRAGS